ncbi:MAG: DNA recombination protein RmuC [Armatimonadetes bacterium]|nr:DNA recombination protein RmuC [Armatimonadota bacterium]MBS1725277.1 DNA recombination protein RmuC [Armatimonadota bacterium]
MSSISILFLLVGLALGAGVAVLMVRSRFQVMESAMRERMENAENDSKEKQAKVSELLSLEGEIRHLRESIQARTQEAESERSERVKAQTELQTSQSVVAEKEEALARERKRFLEEKEQLENSFANLSKQALSQAQESFLQLAKEKFADERKVGQKEIDEVLAPMKQTLEQLREHTRDLEQKRTESYTELMTQVRGLMASTNRLGNALQRPEVRGSWGELTLRRAAEHAGLVEGTDFEMQVSTSTEDGRFRPDMIVRLPNDRVIVVDAKTPLHAYLAASETQDPSEKQVRLKEHSAQVKKHILQLSTKSYQGLYADTADFVVMFVPSEALYQVAIQEDPGLLDEAFNRKVILANPMTLVALLKTIANGMQQQKAYENALQIAKLGGELHDSVAVFAEHFSGVGKALGSAVKKYNEGIGSLERNVLPKTRRIKEMGAKTQKALEEPEILNAVVKPHSLPTAAKDEVETESLF